MPKRNIVTHLARLALLLAALTSSSGAYAQQVALNLITGWNLLGNSSAASIDVATTFNDAGKITTVWTWNKAASKWAFYAPSMTASALTTYAQGKGYDVLTSIAPKEGFWVNASTAVALTGPAVNGVTLLEGDLQQGWNLLGSADNKTPSQLNQGLSGSLGAAGKAMVSAWAWDATNTQWKFYAPSLEAQGGTVLADYIAGKGYLPFNTALSDADGVWLNIGAAGGAGGSTTTTVATTTTTTKAPATTTTTAAPTTTTTTAAPTTTTTLAATTTTTQAPATTTTSAAPTTTTTLAATTTTTQAPAATTTTAAPTTTTTVTTTTTTTQAPTTGSGTLTIVKDAQPDDPQDFHFTTVGAGLSAFDLDDNPTDGALPNSKTFTNLAAGVSFTVTEDAVSGWTVPSIQCLVAVPGLTSTFTDQLNRTFTVNLEAGADVTCTFTNLKTPTPGTGTLTIVKDAQPNDPQDFHFTTVGAGLSGFNLDDDPTDGALPNSKTFANLPAGVPFTVTEDAVSGWTVPSIQCLVAVPSSTSTFTDQLNRTFTVNLEAGADVTCTFTNLKTPTGPITFTAIDAPTLQVSTVAMIPTVLQTSTSFTGTTGGNSGTATVTAGPLGGFSPNWYDGIFIPTSFASPFPVDTLVGAVATLPGSISLASGIALSMTSTSLASLVGLSSADFGVWAIKNDVSLPGSQPPVFVMTYDAFAGGTQLTTAMPTSGTATYTGKLTGVLANTPIGGSDDVSGNVSLSVDFANGTITGQFTGIANVPGASTLPGTTAFNGSFAAITLLSGGTISGNGFSAPVATTSIPGATTATMKANFYGATASEVAGTFTISVPSLGSPGAGLIFIGSFGAK